MSKENVNLMVTSAGRRVELVKSFKDSISKLGLNVGVFAADMNPEYSSACLVADRFFKVPPVNSSSYIEFLLGICLENSIRIVVPTIDTELLCFSENVGVFRDAGIDVVVSDMSFVEFCRDKRKTGKLFVSLGISYPEIFSRDSLKFPCFCKPYDGSRSAGAKALLAESDLTPDDVFNSRNIFMELIPSDYCEYTVDGYYDRLGRLCSLVCRERIEVRDGEVSKGITRKDFVYDYLISRLGKVSGARGCITFQFFVNKNTADLKGLEINPRFGGGYPLTHAAGAVFTEYLLSEYLLGHEVGFYDAWEDNLLMLRYDAAIYSKDEK